MAVKLFMEHATSESLEATLICTSLKYLQLEVGSSLPVLATPLDTWSFLATPCWLKTLW